MRLVPIMLAAVLGAMLGLVAGVTLIGLGDGEDASSLTPQQVVALEQRLADTERRLDALEHDGGPAPAAQRQSAAAAGPVADDDQGDDQRGAEQVVVEAQEEAQAAGPPPEEAAPAEQAAVDRTLPVAAIAVTAVTTHAVQAGDTLARITVGFDTTLDAILALNDIDDPSHIFVGQIITVSRVTRSITIPAPVEARLEPVTLLRVIDGDTLEVRRSDGERDTVRIIGVDTPEVSGGTEPLGPAATARLTALLDGAAAIFLEADRTERDRFDRLLRYLWIRDQSGQHHLVNAVLVAEGLARVWTFPPDERYLDTFTAAQDAAQAARLGVWGLAGTDPTVACDPSYPTVCIPPPPPDLNCPDINYRDFTVSGPDPHRFDADRDGIGCAS